MAQVTRETAIGQEFTGKPKRITWERLWTFSGGPFNTPGWPRKNIHTDTQFAIDCGLPTVAASATQFQGHMTELMIDLFGESWLSGGEMTLKFIKAVPDGDVLHAKVKVTSREDLGGGVKFGLDAWVENKNGEPVATGTAVGKI